MQVTNEQLIIIAYCTRNSENSKPILRLLHKTIKERHKTAVISNKYREEIQIYCKEYLNTLEGLKKGLMNSPFIRKTIIELKQILNTLANKR